VALTALLAAVRPLTTRATPLASRADILEPPPSSALIPGQEQFDATRYDLTLDLDFDTGTLDGSVTVYGTALVDGFQEVILDLHQDLEVTAALSGEHSLAFVHQDSALTVTLQRTFTTGEDFFCTVFYNGTPPQQGTFLGFAFDQHNGQPIASSISQPRDARNWWPCKDTPVDKAFVTTHITVPDTMIAVSNGQLMLTTPAGSGRTTYHWDENYPIATYLISVTATNYTGWEETYVTASQDSMPVVYYAYPERLALAQEDWSLTVPMLEAFVDAFDEEYPFIDEKYGMAMIEAAGGFEHQTCTSYGSGAVTGTHENDVIVAHELAHSWWGNLVTPAAWNDIWLSEGLATWCEALWLQRSAGWEAYHDHLRDLGAGQFLGTIYAPDYLYSRTVYNKGAWVVHMLRHIMGEEAFFQLLRSWAAAYGYANASTAQFTALAASVHGSDLAWFFAPWLYDEGRPQYRYRWSWQPADIEYEVFLQIEQIQTHGPIFRMPIDIGLQLASGDTLMTTVVDSLPVQEVTIPVSEPPLALYLDPYDWILKFAVEIPIGIAEAGAPPAARPLRLARVAPNPVAAGGTSILYELGEAAHVRAAVYDATGRMVARLGDAWQPRGRHRLTWDGRQPGAGTMAASGVYFLRLEAGGAEETRRLVVLR
jgi:aminopeptidase N